MSPDSQQSKYVCTDCGRSYKAVETLNRHRKNHVAAVQYTCSACNASFKRKDLLDRHCLIHDSGKPVTNTHRSTKACDRCQRLKTKCNGSSPCTRCERGGHFCTYRQTISRARTGRSSIGALSAAESFSPSHSPRISIDEGGSPGSQSYSLSDPGDSILTDQSHNSDDSWRQMFWTQQSSPWQWPNIDPNLEGNPTVPDQVDFLQLQHSSNTAWNISEHLPTPPPTCTSIEGFQIDPLQLPRASDPIWSEDLAMHNISECLPTPPVTCGSIEDVFASYTTTASWSPQYATASPQIDPALGNDIYNVDDYSTIEAPYAYVPCSRG